MIDAGPRKSLDYDDMKYAVVLYAYGTALAGTGLHMNIETARSIFQNIITSLKTINFPLAYYGLSRSLIRQNRFHEAIQILNEGLNLMNQLTCEINWPGTDIVIDETQTGKLESSLNNALTTCKYPPKADAICRYEKCLGMKKSIYISDLDYNGYVGIVCTEACLVEYHIQCWKKFKSSFIDLSSDKDFLGTKCITSNCNGEIKLIKIYDSEGLKTELLSDKLKLKKDKVQVTVNSKKKKRSKKKGKHVASEDSMKERVSEVLDEKPCSLPSDEMQSLDIPLKDEKDPSKEKIHLTEKDHEELSMVPESGMFVLKKDYDQTENLGTKPLKGKHRKKKTKNVQSLDEFLGPDNENLRLRPYQHDEENYDEIPSESFTRRPPEGWNRNLFSIPAHLKHEAQEIENSLSLSNHDSIREYVCSAFNNLLKVQGPLHIESDQMERLFNIMPEEVHSIVRDEGGLRKFLKNLNFIIEGDIIQSYEDKLITDRKMSLTKPYEENTKNATEGDIFTAKIVHLSNATGKEYLRNNTDDLSLTGTYFENGVNFDSWVRAKEFMPSQKSLPTSNDAVGFHEIHVLTDDIDRANNLNLLETSVNCMDEKTNDALSTANSAKAFYSKREESATVYPETYNSLNSLPADHGENIYKISSVDHSDDVKQVFMREKEISIVGDSDTSSSIMKYVRTTVATQTTASSLSKEYTEDIMKESKNETIVDNDSKTKLAVNITHQHVERKSTKEKGILCKPNTKTKITMTDPTSELTKVEVDKLLRSAKTWENKYLDEQVKNTRMEKNYKTEIGNLQKRLQECRQNLQVLAEEHEEYKAFHSREIQDFTTEKRERDERIKQLEEKVILTVVGEERRREELQVELTALRKEKEQWKLDEGKLRKLLELQAKRACDAEINFLELQRSVNFGAFTRALQESELTLHHINQILSANFTPQLQDFKVQWQRYIVDCKFKFDRNKSMFDSSITKLKEGIPLSSLTSLRIVHPSPYPGPPILQLPPGISAPPGNKTFPKHVNKSNQATVSTHGSFAFPGGTSTSMGFRSLGPERFPVNPTTSTNHKESETDTKPANNYEKIILRLSTQFPCYTRNEIIFFIKKLRASKSGSLTGLSFDDVVDCVAKLIKEREQQMSNAIASAAAGPSNSIATRAQTSASRTSSLPLTRPQSTLPQKPSTSASKLAPTAIKPVIQASKSLATSAFTTTKTVSSASLLCYEDPCVICHDEMSDATKNVSLDCGHKFHHDCIKKWLTGEQSTCPTCRVHALLPDEFPQLK
ncbi:uncharacterized protein LOC124446205 isoform X2 [Xenia sp. Carnegie-2017]|uniref:uncharacterized protein LOC124446205 isoform X2 n=1 Tax=Xenia sp. Carnegie-2017 TaxID=2897299 RepID=UPI001F04B3EC|nr:uncharacterized protein LOC124446205 isoform X2 [Xenia sp. Carnegie-2017]